MRAVPHDGSIAAEDYVEVLDYEKAAAIIDTADRFAIGICSCRHEHEHVGGRTCKVPLDTCSRFGATSVGFMVRNGLAREVSKAEMLDNLARSRDLGLVLNADNVQRKPGFMCHCCGCCCNVLRGISRHGYPNAVVTSSYIAEPDTESCTGCGICTRNCPVQAIGRADDPAGGPSPWHAAHRADPAPSHSVLQAVLVPVGMPAANRRRLQLAGRRPENPAGTQRVLWTLRRDQRSLRLDGGRCRESKLRTPDPGGSSRSARRARVNSIPTVWES